MSRDGGKPSFDKHYTADGAAGWYTAVPDEKVLRKIADIEEMQFRYGDAAALIMEYLGVVPTSRDMPSKWQRRWRQWALVPPVIREHITAESIAVNPRLNEQDQPVVDKVFLWRQRQFPVGFRKLPPPVDFYKMYRFRGVSPDHDDAALRQRALNYNPHGPDSRIWSHELFAGLILSPNAYETVHEPRLVFHEEDVRNFGSALVELALAEGGRNAQTAAFLDLLPEANRIQQADVSQQPVPTVQLATVA